MDGMLWPTLWISCFPFRVQPISTQLLPVVVLCFAMPCRQNAMAADQGEDASLPIADHHWLPPGFDGEAVQKGAETISDGNFVSAQATQLHDWSGFWPESRIWALVLSHLFLNSQRD